ALLIGAGFAAYRAKAEWTWPLLAFLAAGLALAVEVGHGRAGLVAYYGLPDRYALIAVPVLCCAYLVYDRYGGPTWRRLGPGLLCAAMAALLPLNVIYGFQFRDWYHRLVDGFANDITAGVPVDALAYYGSIDADRSSMATSLRYLRQAHIGVFGQLREVAVPGLGREIDGLDAGGGGWYTLGGGSSVGVLEGSAASRVLRWDYDVIGAMPTVLGRSFLTPQDWSRTGAIALTVVGQASGRTVDVRLATSTGSVGVDRYDSTFTDDRAGSRTVVIPWDGFQHVNSRGHFDLLGPMPLEHVAAVAFGVAGPGRGALVIQRVALEPGHGQRGWPLSSASNQPLIADQGVGG
ncbi:MAG TPA: CIA30 family protein, partial [Acidimicrobiales bacterium]